MIQKWIICYWRRWKVYQAALFCLLFHLPLLCYEVACRIRSYFWQTRHFWSIVENTAKFKIFPHLCDIWQEKLHNRLFHNKFVIIIIRIIRNVEYNNRHLAVCLSVCLRKAVLYVRKCVNDSWTNDSVVLVLKICSLAGRNA